MADLPLVYLIGDSISLQYGPCLQKYLSGSWRYERKVGETEALLNLDNPQGANGGDSSMVLDFFQHIMQSGSFHPDLLLINCGAHDIKRDAATGAIQIPLPDYERNLREIVALAASRKIPLAWIRSAPFSEAIHNARRLAFQRFQVDFEAYDDAARKAMAECSIPMIDLYTFTRNLGTDADLFCDHAHFHEAVREKQAAFLAGWLNAYGSCLSTAAVR